MDSCVILVEAKHPGAFGAAWLETMACMGMVYRSRVVGGKQNATLYRIYSNGMMYRFVTMDNN